MNTTEIQMRNRDQPCADNGLPNILEIRLSGPANEGDGHHHQFFPMYLSNIWLTWPSKRGDGRHRQLTSRSCYDDLCWRCLRIMTGRGRGLSWLTGIFCLDSISVFGNFVFLGKGRQTSEGLLLWLRTRMKSSCETYLASTKCRSWSFLCFVKINHDFQFQRIFSGSGLSFGKYHVKQTTSK